MENTINTILFDLDGTLLQMDTEKFTYAYFKLLSQKMAGLFKEPNKFGESLMKATYMMINNEGTMTNEDMFWLTFEKLMDTKKVEVEDKFNTFYEEDFNELNTVATFNPLSNKIVKLAKKKGYKIVLATNPLFPHICTAKRIKWAGLEEADFDLITTYENFNFAKPNPLYYQKLLSELGISGDQALMIGNDTRDDLVSHEVGIANFIVVDYLINKENVDINLHSHGSLLGLYSFVESLPDLN